MHAAGALLVVDGKLAAVVAHALGGAHVHDLGLDVHAVLGVVGDFVLVDLDVALPGADDGAVGAGDGRHAVDGAAGNLDLELVGEHRAVQFVLELMGHLMADLHGVDVRPFAAGSAQAAAGGPHGGAGTTKVPSTGGDFREERLESLGTAAQHDHVAGRTVHVGQARTVLVPQVHDGPERVGLVVEPAGLVDTHGMEMGNTGEFIGERGVPSDNSTAVTENADDTAVFPVTTLRLVRLFELSQLVIGHLVSRRGFFDFGNETRPRTLFEFVHKWRVVLLHLIPPSVV